MNSLNAKKILQKLLAENSQKISSGTKTELTQFLKGLIYDNQVFNPFDLISLLINALGRSASDQATFFADIALFQQMESHFFIPEQMIVLDAFRQMVGYPNILSQTYLPFRAKLSTQLCKALTEETTTTTPITHLAQLLKEELNWHINRHFSSRGVGLTNFCSQFSITHECFNQLVALPTNLPRLEDITTLQPQEITELIVAKATEAHERTQRIDNTFWENIQAICSFWNAFPATPQHFKQLLELLQPYDPSAYSHIHNASTIIPKTFRTQEILELILANGAEAISANPYEFDCASWWSDIHYLFFFCNQLPVNTRHFEQLLAIPDGRKIEIPRAFREQNQDGGGPAFLFLEFILTSANEVDRPDNWWVNVHNACLFFHVGGFPTTLQNFSGLLQFAPILLDHHWDRLRNQLPPHLQTQETFDHIIDCCTRAENQQLASQAVNAYIYDLLGINRRAIAAPARNAPARNDAQSTHTASVHASVSESATKLMEEYGSKIATKEQLEDILQYVWAWKKVARAESIPAAQHAAAIDCLTSLEKEINSNYVDPKSNVSIRQLLALVWLALNDQEQTHAEWPDAEKQLVLRLYEIQRGYNINDEGVDNQREASPICTSGTFNHLMLILNGIHPLVEIRKVTKPDASAYFPFCARRELILYLKQHPEKISEFLKNPELDEPLWLSIKDSVYTQLWDEFKEAYDCNEKLFDNLLISQWEMITLKFTQKERDQLTAAQQTKPEEDTGAGVGKPVVVAKLPTPNVSEIAVPAAVMQTLVDDAGDLTITEETDTLAAPSSATHREQKTTPALSYRELVMQNIFPLLIDHHLLNENNRTAILAFALSKPINTLVIFYQQLLAAEQLQQATIDALLNNNTLSAKEQQKARQQASYAQLKFFTPAPTKHLAEQLTAALSQHEDLLLEIYERIARLQTGIDDPRLKNQHAKKNLKKEALIYLLCDADVKENHRKNFNTRLHEILFEDKWAAARDNKTQKLFNKLAKIFEVEMPKHGLKTLFRRGH